MVLFRMFSVVRYTIPLRSVTTTDVRVMLFDIPSGRRLPCNIDPVNATAIAFSPQMLEGMILAVATQDEQIVAYNVAVNEVVGVWDCCGRVDLLAFSQEIYNREVRFAVAEKGKRVVEVFSVEGGRFIKRLDIAIPITNLAFYPHPRRNDFILAVVAGNAPAHHREAPYGYEHGYGCAPMHGYDCGEQYVMAHNSSVQFWDIEQDICLRSHPIPSDLITNYLVFAPLCHQGLFFTVPTRDVGWLHVSRLTDIEVERDRPPAHEYGCPPVHEYGYNGCQAYNGW